MLQIFSPIKVFQFIIYLQMIAFTLSFEVPASIINVEIWQLTYKENPPQRVNWTPFENSSQPRGKLNFPGPSEAKKLQNDSVERTSEGLVILPFPMRRKGEGILSGSDIEDRIEIFTRILGEGLDLPKGKRNGKGRRFVVRPKKEEVLLIDTEIHAIKAQIIYQSLFPPVLIVRSMPPPKKEQLSQVITVLQTKKRSPAEMEKLLNQITGRTRTDNDQFREDRSERSRTRITSDSVSGNIVLSNPSNRNTTSNEPLRPRTQVIVPQYEQVDVHVEKAAVSHKRRFRRFGPLNTSLLPQQLSSYGNVRKIASRSFQLINGKTVTLQGGSFIPFLHYQPGKGEAWIKPQSAKKGVSLNLIPTHLKDNSYQVTLLLEITDFKKYPTLEKIYLDDVKMLNVGDTLVCKQLVPGEILRPSPGRNYILHSETLILITLQ